MKNKSLMANLALFAAALIWGSSFIIMKNSVDVFMPFTLLAVRFTIGTTVLALIFCKRLKQIDKDYLKSGVIIGVCLFIAYGTQTIGITDTSPGKNAFLTAIYCVIVPFLFWITSKKRPDKYNFVSAFMCIVGIGLVSLTETLTIGFGDTFTLIGGFFYAVHMIAIVQCSKGKDPVILTVLQFAVATVLAWIVSLTCESFPTQISQETIFGMCYLGVFPTAVAMLCQNIGQKYTNPTSAGIIMSLESVFGVMFSVMLGAEILTPRIIAGFAVIFAAVIVSETKLDFLKHKNGAKQ